MPAEVRVEFDLHQHVLVPLLVFGARVLDVSIGTVRIMLLQRGSRVAVPLGFVEVMIWLLAIGNIMQNLTNPLCYLAFAGGFATGSLLGMAIEGRLALGTQVVRVITRADATALIEALRALDFGVTVVPAEGATGPVQILYTVAKRAQVPAVVEKVREFNPRAFYVVEDVRAAREGVFPQVPRGRLGK